MYEKIGKNWYNIYTNVKDDEIKAIYCDGEWKYLNLVSCAESR